MLNELNVTTEVPKIGDMLVIMTKKTKEKIACKVKGIVNGNEVVLQKSTNSYFIWDMYMRGESWVWRVWNLGDIKTTTSLNNTNQFGEY